MLTLEKARESDGSGGLQRLLDGWGRATPENTTTDASSDGGDHASGWTYRGHLPASDWSSIIGDCAWEASGSNVPTLVTTIQNLRPGTVYEVSATFIGIDPKRKEINWGIDVGFAPEELSPFTIGSEGVTATGNGTTT
jgi:hypothetical protein